MLATIRDDTWNVFNIQHITQNWNISNYSDTPGSGQKKILAPANMVEGGHHPHLTKSVIVCLYSVTHAMILINKPRDTPGRLY